MQLFGLFIFIYILLLCEQYSQQGLDYLARKVSHLCFPHCKTIIFQELLMCDKLLPGEHLETVAP